MRKTRVFSVGIFILLLLACATLTGVFAQELAEEEIRGVTGGDISFTNYEGPYDKIESDEEIRSIGRRLSSGIEEAEGQSAVYFDKYSIVRVGPVADAEGYGADIFRINRGARVDHIDNVRRMISGYVQNVFGYSQGEADTIAVFLTFYNAVHRGDMEYFGENYHEGVTDEIDPEKAGIATNYTQWPGNTELLIPLRTVGEETALSTDTVGEDEVVERIREEEEDRGVEDRKEMVEIRERELEEEEEETERAREELEEREREIEKEEAETEEAERELEETREEEGEDSPEAEEAEEELEQRREETEREREEIEEEQERVEEEEEEQQERRESIQEERERISEDQQEQIEEEEEQETTREEPAEQEEAEEAPETVHFILFEEGDKVFGRLVEVEKTTGSILRRADINTIRSKDMVMGSEGVVVVAGNDDPPRAVRLVEIDGEELKISRQSQEDIYQGSALEKREDSIYAVTKHEDRWYVGRFTEELEQAARSSEEVAPQTMLLLEDGSLFVQDSGGDVILLEPDTLRRKQE